MKLLLVRHLWGVDQSAGLQPHLAHWREVGYGALESSLTSTQDRPAFAQFLREHQLEWIAGVYSDDFRTDGSVRRHLASLEGQMREAAPLGPVLINAHSGLDRWSQAEMEDYFGEALNLERRYGIPLCHETHRRRCLATPWAAAAVMKTFPTLKLTADLSHWVCVTERLLEDFGEVLDQVARQTRHIHARVGFEHGPQVPDPSAPEWQPQLEAHERWWSSIWRAQENAGMAVSTLTPEFGPPPYLWTWPHTGKPAADLPAVCDWMARRMRSRFAKQIGGAARAQL